MTAYGHWRGWFFPDVSRREGRSGYRGTQDRFLRIPWSL